jgi:RNA polymerase sigma-70 factor (ECF subfamily)
VEAAIASIHSMVHRVEVTDWGQIVSHCYKLMILPPSPVVALNRAIARHEGPERGLEEIRAISGAWRV